MHSLSPHAQDALDRYLEGQAELNGGNFDAMRRGQAYSIASQNFTAGQPSVQQRLIQLQQERHGFLKAINLVEVAEQEGESLGLGIGSPIASRTDTSAVNSPGRKPVDPTAVTVLDRYHCKQTNSDTFLKYAKLDAWAKFPNFETMLRNLISDRQALDRILIGWNGVSAALTTDPVANPLRQDTNIGWLQKYRTGKPLAVYDEGETEAGKIIIDPTGAGDYKTIDALVTAAIFEMIPSWNRQDPGLVVILGENLLHDVYFPLLEETKPTEINAANVILSGKRIAGRQPISVPYFPPNALAVTTLDNLSIYEQEGKRRRKIEDNPKFDRVDTYESSNDAYVIEDFDRGCIVENIQFGPTEGGG